MTAPLSPDARAALLRGDDARAPSRLTYRVASELLAAGLIVSLSNVALTPRGIARREMEAVQ